MNKQLSLKELITVNYVLTALVFMAMFVYWFFILLAYDKLPEYTRMPFHMGQSPDYLGPKIGFILRPLVLSTILLIMAGLRVFPIAILIPRPITPKNGYTQYRNAGWLMHGWQLAVVFWFGGITVNEYRLGMHQPEVLGLWFTLTTIVLFIIPLLVFLYASSKVEVDTNEHIQLKVARRVMHMPYY